MVMDARADFKRKEEKAMLFSSRYWSIVVDGAGQSAFGLPHFVTKVKGEHGCALKARLFGLLEHQKQPCFYLFIMTEERATEANHIIETIRRFISGIAASHHCQTIFILELTTTSGKTRTISFFPIWKP